MSENLVYVGKIVSLDAIEGADFIVAATVVCGKGGKWRGVVKKCEFSSHSKCRVYLPDSLIPESDDMQFMAATKWRVKMRRYKGVPSEALILPFVGLQDVGEDITEICGVIKYIKPVPANLAGKVKGEFPGFVPKTDEPNWQASEDLINELKGNPYYVMEKADGSSTTAYKWKGKFGVCSRNWEIVEDSSNGYWEICNRYNLRETLTEGYALQWETCGPKIQSNPMGFNEVTGLAFSVYNIECRRYLDYIEFLTFCAKIKFPTVKILNDDPYYDITDLTELARGKYKNGNIREGIVIRSCNRIKGRIISFKAINLDYKG